MKIYRSFITVLIFLFMTLGANAKKKMQDYPRTEIKVSYNYHKKSMRNDGVVVERDVPFILLANNNQSKFYFGLKLGVTICRKNRR